MNNGRFSLALAFVFSILARSVVAAPVPELSEFFARQIGGVSPAVAACSLQADPSSLASGAPETWDYDAFFLLVNPYVSFGVPSVVSIQVSPEIEFIWDKEQGAD